MIRFILTLLISLPFRSSGFSPAGSLITPRATAVVGRSSSWSSVTLMAAKKRRRRKSVPSPTDTQTDDLPDFDDGEADDIVEFDEEEPIQSTTAAMASMPPSAKVTPVKRGAGLNSKLAEEVGGNVEGLDEDTILEAMRGKAGSNSWEPPRSIQDTLQDRSLEKFMDFDKMIEQDGGGAGRAMELPDFDEVIARRKQKEAMQEGRVEDAAMLIDTSAMGKKAARNAQRKAAAMQREAELEEEKNPFEDLNILKLLENGAWVGIGLLVVWEIYINSPFFDRAAPLIPVVYDDVTPPGM